MADRPTDHLWSLLPRPTRRWPTRCPELQGETAYKACALRARRLQPLWRTRRAGARLRSLWPRPPRRLEPSLSRTCVRAAPLPRKDKASSASPFHQSTESLAARLRPSGRRIDYFGAAAVRLASRSRLGVCPPRRPFA